MKAHLCFITILVTLLIFCNKSGHAQSVQPETSKVLMLHSMKEKRPWNLMYNQCFRDAVNLNENLKLKVFIENLDLLEYQDEKYKDILEEMLVLKYKNNLPDLLIITQPTAVKFIFDRNLFSNIPKILILPSKQGFENYPNATIITYAADFEAQFNHSLKVFPETKEVYVVAGNSMIDQSTLDKFMHATRKFNKQILFKYLTNLNRDSILNITKNLPENSFVYYLSYTQDLNGKAYMAKDFSFDLAQYCNRPVFCYLDLLTENTGILGGMVVSLKSTATITVEFIEKYVEGTPIEKMNSTASNLSNTYDWNELKKWNVDVRKLPMESVFYKRTYSFFELYKYEVMLGIILIAFYTLLLILLLYNNRKRKQNERDLIEKNEEYEAINEELTQTNQELYHANARIEESMNRLHLFINTIPDLVWLKDINGIYLECNNRFEDFFGCKREDIIGKSDYDFVSKDLADFFKIHDQAAMSAGKPTLNEEQITFASDGHQEFLETIKTPLYNGEGGVLGVLGIGRDISERLRAEQELFSAKEKAEENELKLKLIANNFVNGMLYQVALIDETKRKFNYVSEAVNELYDCSAEEAMQNPDLIYGKVHPDDIGELMEKEKEALKNMSTFQTESRVFKPDGSIRWTYYISKPRIINGVTCWDGIEIDITERKLMEIELLKAKEKAEESDRLKTEFINNMSHEIRTPMTGIIGFSRFLNKENLSTEKRAHYISIIQNSGNQLMRIIDDILEISKLGTKQVEAIENEVCLNDLCLELFSIFDIKAKENKTPLYFKKGLSDQESSIFTDESKLNKILSNLLENALKYTNEGFIELGYQATVKDGSHASQLEIYVKDTGIGISADKQETVFERFSQEEKELSKKFGGLGLGLSIAKENAELLGGTITLESEKGKGSIFRIIIPYKPVSDDQEKGNSNQQENKTEKSDQYSILIVEDEEVNFLYLETLLEDVMDVNYSILHAKNGKEAVEICQENQRIRFVLMDIKMPVMNGFEATKQIKAFRPDLPIVAQTAYTSKEDKEKATTAGCDDFISKPIREDTFKEIINKYMMKK